jgi:polar amino acid transport system substrate-binding protein
MPTLFDPRERIAKPDIASIERIRFLTTVDFPPFNFIDQSGKLNGFHIDLAREMCRELRIVERCQVEAMAFSKLVETLDKGGGEVVLAGVRITPQLRREHDFSRVFMQLPARFVTTRQRLKTLAGPEAIADGEVGVIAGTAHEAMLKAFFPALKAKAYPDRAEQLAAIRKGEVAAIFGDGLQLSFWIESEDAANCCAYLGGPYYSSFFFGEGLAMMTRKDMPELTRALDSALVALARNGRLNDIYLRYFPNGL